MNRHKSNIDRLVETLRQDCTEVGMERAVQVFSPEPVVRGTTAKRTWLLRTLAVAGCASLIGLGVLLPQRSSAASSLENLVAAQKHSNVMFHIQPYWVDSRGKTPKVWSGYVLGNRWRYVQENFEQAFDGVHMTTYSHFSGQPYATVEEGSDRGSGQFLQSAFLDGFKEKCKRDLTLERGVVWRGRSVDRFVHRFPYTDELGNQRVGVSTLYADPVRGLPLYFEDIYSSSKGNALEWEYIEPAREDLMRINLPKGVPVREITGQREPVPLSAPAKARAAQG